MSVLPELIYRLRDLGTSRNSESAVPAAVNALNRAIRAIVGGNVPLDAIASAVRLSRESIHIDAHYGALLGIGSRAAEPLQELLFDLSTPVSGGSQLIKLTNLSSGLITGQLIVLLADDGEYYSHRVTSVAGGDIGISPAASGAVTSLSNAVGTFYKDTYHPSVYGYRAIADYCLRNLKARQLEEVFFLNKNSSSSTIATDSTNSMLNMGSQAIVGKNVTTTNSVTQGIFYQGRVKRAGNFEFDVQTFSASPVIVYVAIDGNASYQWTIPSGYSGVSTFRFTTKEQYQQVVIRVVADGNPATVNVAESVKIYSESIVVSANYGKHCLIGDSWFFQTGFYQRLVEKLPGASIVNKAVGGRKASDVLAAFGADVTENYDFIWCVCGTNDYVSGITAASFSNSVARIKGLAINNGANFVFLGSSVGPADTQATEFNLSRQYAKLTDLSHDHHQTEYTLTLPTTTVPAGSSQVIANLGYFDPEITITGYYTFGAGVSMRHKSTIAAGSGTQILALNDNSLSLNKATYNVGPARLVDVFANNVSGAPITYGGYITYLK